MSLVSKLIPSLTGGVSQQSPAFRAANQAEQEINGWNHIIQGLSKRPGTEHLAKLGSIDGTDCFYHVNRRDSLEKYHILLSKDGYLIVRDENGLPCSVIKDPLIMSGYLDSTTPVNDYLAVSVADHTYILNKTKIAQKKDTLSSTRGAEGLVYVKSVDYRTNFSVTITKGASTMSLTFTTKNSVQDDTSSTQVAETGATVGNVANMIYYCFNNMATEYNSLKNYYDSPTAAATSLPSNMDCMLVGSSVYFYNINGDATEFTITTSDGAGDTLLYGFKESVEVFTDLPQINPVGFIIKVSGFNTKNADDYWVEGTGEGWKEVRKPGSTFEWDAYTLPATLRKDSEGVFHLEPTSWANRTVGDDDTNPWPSFEGCRINDIFFYKDRIGLLSDENIILGRTSQYISYDFFRINTLTKLDTDPIDLSVSSNEVSILRHAVPFAGTLLLFSDLSQFKLTHNGPLTYATATISTTTRFASTMLAKPRNVGKYVYFAGKRGAFASVWEFEVDSTATIYSAAVDEAREITAHVPEYLVGEVANIQASPNNHCLLVQTTNDLNDIYIYNYFWNGNERIQSSWSLWRFSGTVCGTFLDGDTLSIVVGHDDGQLYLESLNINVDAALAGGSRSAVLLDRRYTLSPDSPVLPYTTVEPVRYVNIHGKSISKTVAKAAVTAGDTVWAGVDYTFLFEFSQFIPVINQQPVLSGRATLRSYLINYTNTAFFKINVLRGTQSWSRPFNSRYISIYDNLLDDVVLESGQLRVPVTGKNDQIRVQIENDSHLPCVFNGAEAEAYFTSGNQRM
jgi:hypothetical protein